jgi:hypothetical protein
MGKFEAAELKGVDLIIKFEFIKLLRKMLLRFNADATDVSATERYYVIQDGELRFGFERYGFHFPDISAMYQHTSDNHCLVPRNQLGACLTLLAAVNKNPHLLVEIKVQGDEGNDLLLRLMTRERTGLPCRDFLRVARRCNPGYTTSAFPDWEFSVPIAVLRELVAHFDSTNVSSRFLATKLCMFMMRTGTARPIV